MDQFALKVGYSGKRIGGFVEILRAAGVDLVVDVRELPLSRAKGFSKSPLRAALADAGIEYVHLRAAGNPYRDRKSDIQTCLAMYASHIDSHPTVLDDVDRVIAGRRAALLCVEATACECHRSILADRLLRKHPGRTVQHL